MTIRFLADENFDHRTLAGLLRREPDLDIVSVQEVGRATAGGRRCGAGMGRAGGRIVVTHDASTMLDHANERVATGLPMPGVFEIPDQTPRSVIIEELLLVAAASDPGE